MDSSLLKVGFWHSASEPELPDPLDLVDLDWNFNERSTVSAYLDSGEIRNTYREFVSCRLCGSRIGSHQELTDGTWVWPSSLSHYVKTHSIRPSSDFLKHVYSSEKGKYYVALMAARDLMQQCPGIQADPSSDVDGSPLVKAYVPKGATAHHVPDLVMGVPVKKVEFDYPVLQNGAYDNVGKAIAGSTSPIRVSEILKKIATSVESYEKPSLNLLSTKLRILIASLEDDLVLVFQSSGSTNDLLAIDDGSIQDAVDLELMQAGAKSVDWDSNNLYVIVPPGSKVAVLQSFNDMKGGELGDEIAGFLQPMQLDSAEELEQTSLDVRRAAARIARRKRQRPTPKRPRPRTSQPVVTEDMLIPSTEYSCQVELSLTADFEGVVPKQKLLKKLRTELVAAIKTGVTVTAREYHLEPTGVHVKPIKIECAINDMGSPEEELEPEVEEVPRRRKGR